MTIKNTEGEEEEITSTGSDAAKCCEVTLKFWKKEDKEAKKIRTTGVATAWVKIKKDGKMGTYPANIDSPKAFFLKAFPALPVHLWELLGLYPPRNEQEEEENEKNSPFSTVFNTPDFGTIVYDDDFAREEEDQKERATKKNTKQNV